LACSSDFLEHNLKLPDLHRLSFSDLKYHVYVGRYLRFSELMPRTPRARDNITGIK